MSIQIKEMKRGKWLASRGNSNMQLTDDQLYRFLIAHKAQGFKIKFYSNK